MRIGVFSESYEPIINGVTVCVQTLRDELCRQGHDVFVFAPAYDGFVDPYDRVFRFPSARTFLARDYPIPIPFSPRIRNSFRKLDLDIVHTQTPFLLGILGGRWARRGGIPIVSTNHTLYAKYTHYSPLPGSVTERIIVTHMRRYYNGCDGVVVPSKITHDLLRGYGVRSRIEVITSGVNDGGPAPTAGDFRERMGIPSGAKTLLYVGRLAIEKNLDMLLSAFAVVYREDADAWLTLVGAGPYERPLRDQAERLGVANRVVFTGLLPRAEALSAYASADVFVSPSITETQGLVVCEALSAGVPCVAVNGGGTPECLEDGVDSILTPNDAAAFAGSVLELLRDEKRRSAMAARALKNSVRFSTSEWAAKFIEFYSSVIANCKRGET
ncbi:MAG: glycosyltransferase [Armatimonadota bacterium]|nr:glycosyltransferase [Armatimonadota bacterium]